MIEYVYCSVASLKKTITIMLQEHNAKRSKEDRVLSMIKETLNDRNVLRKSTKALREIIYEENMVIVHIKTNTKSLCML